MSVKEPILGIDFETRSAIDLTKRGLDPYAKDKTTHIHCMAFAFDEDEPDLWLPTYGRDPFVSGHVRNGGVVRAFNAPFELAIWNHILVPRYGYPKLHPEQVRCTMAMAYALALPGSLENAASAMGLEQRKDNLGKRIMLKLCKPYNDDPENPLFYTPESNPEDFDILYEYCKQDVKVERELAQRLLQLSPDEQQTWVDGYYRNQRGIQIDLPAVHKAIKVVEGEVKRINARVKQLTDGRITSVGTEHDRVAAWLEDRGIINDGVNKAAVIELLKDEDLPADVREVLKLRREAAKASTAKLKAMVNRASSDGRARDIHQYHAAATGREGGRGIQAQNLTRGFLKPKQVEDAIAHMDSPLYLDANYGDPMSVVSSCIRGFITAAPGNDLMACDFSNIEGRVTAWLAGEEWKLQAFRDYDTVVGKDENGKELRKGPDIYLLSYAKSFNIPIEEATPHRQVGKVQELALGFGGGKGAFQQMAKTYGVVVSDDRAEELKLAWRAAHPKINQYWYDLEDAAINAVLKGGTWKAGAPGRQVAYKKSGSFLFCRLPSGRVITYPYPEIREVITPWGSSKDALTFMCVPDENLKKKQGKILPDAHSSSKWVRISTFGGSLCENVTQAVARDALMHGRKTLLARGYDPVMDVHDEIVTEQKIGTMGTPEQMGLLMCQQAAWAAELPVSASGWRGPRYRKD